MRTIYKYPLKVTDEQTIKMPGRGRVLHVDNQDGTLCLWAYIDSDDMIVDRKFRIVGTGHPMPPDVLRYLGTAIIEQFVWHVFEYKRPDFIDDVLI